MNTSSALLGWVCLASLASAHPSSQQTAPYPDRDEVRGSRVQLAAFPIRPMVVAPADGARPARIWAVNQSEDLVEAFLAPASGVNPSFQPVISRSVGWDPVSVAYWAGTSSNTGEILVACRGTYGITRLSAEDGSIIGQVTLVPDDLPANISLLGHGAMAEPGDILVDDATDMAFVSCSGADAVIQIDLTSGDVVRRFNYDHGQGDTQFRCKNPLFLAAGPDPAEGEVRTVLVAPLKSGNNTTLVDGTANNLGNPGRIDVPGVNRTLELNVTPMIITDAPFRNLPDEDLFEITPWAAGTSNGKVNVRLNGLGTILFDHGVNPVTGEHWALTNEMFNGGLDNNTEPKVNGRFAENQMRITPGFAGGGSSPEPAAVLEDANLGPNLGLGQPFALDFDQRGRGFVVGQLSDNVAEFNPDGSFRRGWSLPASSIPRGVLSHEYDNRKEVLVYSWGTGRIQNYSVSGNSVVLLRTFRLTPTSNPRAFAVGKRIFFDGDRSATGTISCATCHVDGGADGLAWDLSPMPIQFKGPMVTQTLVGLEKIGPFHWRGERSLEDFNVAFEGLLGHMDAVNMNQLPPNDLAALTSFIFDLKNPANPHQSRGREVDSRLQRFVNYPGSGTALLNGNAVAGVGHYFDQPALNATHSCNDCHTVPTGTSSTLFPLQSVLQSPALASLKPAPLHELWRKDQPLFDLGIDRQMGILGFGYSHPGSSKDLPSFLSFIETTTPVVPPGGSTAPTKDQMRIDISEFVFQWDQGVAPASHFAFFVDYESVTAPGNPARTQTLYLARNAVQAVKNCDVVVIGKTLINGQLEERRWWRDPSAAAAVAYRCEDSSVPPRGTGDFLDAAEVANADLRESHLFVGYPVGMGERIAVDFDMDGIYNIDEIVAGTNPKSARSPGGTSTTPAAFATPPKVLWRNGKHARIAFSTDVPTKITNITYSEPNNPLLPPVPFTPSGGFTREHAPIIRNLRASTLDELLHDTDPTVGGEMVVYEVEITVETIAGVTTPSSILRLDPEPFILASFTAPDDPKEDSSLDVSSRNQVVVTESEIIQVGNNYEMNATLKYRQGPKSEGPNDHYAVIGHVVLIRNGMDAEVLDETQVLATSASTVKSRLRYNTQNLDSTMIVGSSYEGMNMLPNDFTPPLVVATSVSLTNVADQTQEISVPFSLALSSGLAAGDKLIYAIDAIIRVDQMAWTTGLGGSGFVDIELPTVGRDAMSNFNFPETGEVLTFPTLEF